MKPNEWAEGRVSMMVHNHLCKCDGSSGAREARNKAGVNPKSGRWYSKYSGK